MEKQKPKVVRQSPAGTVRVFDNGTILVKDGRLSYEHIFKKWGGTGDDGKAQEPKFSASMLLPVATRKDDIIFLKREAQRCAKEAKTIGTELGDDRLCVRKGDPSKEEQVGMWGLRASESRRPTIVDKDGKTPLVEEDGKPYSGCYIDLLIRPWAQNHAKFGKRVNANLLSVKFVRDGEAFGGGNRPAPEDVFDDESGAETGREDFDEDDDGF